MKVRVDAALVDFDKKPIMLADADGTSAQLTLDRVIVNALSAAEEKLSGDEKHTRFRLCQKVWCAQEVTLSAQEIAKIKEAIGSSGYAPLVAGQAWDLLEGEVEERLEA